MKYFAWSIKELRGMFENEIPIGKFMDEPSMFPEEEFAGCMKPIEYFCNDIRKNLEAWSKSADNKSIYYKTRNNYYKFSVNPVHKGVINMVCHNKEAKKTISSWANQASISYLGKDFLKDRPENFVPLLPTS